MGKLNERYTECNKEAHSMEILLHVAVPIKKPTSMNPLYEENNDFSFDTLHRFKLYNGNNPTIRLAVDDHDQWWFFTNFTCQSLTECKYSRQIFRIEYMDKSVLLPLEKQLESLKLEISDYSFDKAYAHTSVLVHNLSDVSNLNQSRIANIDGDDDPQISKSIHYIENVFEGQRTRFLAGEETFSFATISENDYYFKKIHIPHVAFLYLRYFVYFMKYSIIPSKQMMPRLLCNLWASKQALQTTWNHHLFTSDQLGSKH